MAEPEFSELEQALISVQYHSLKACAGYPAQVRAAENAGRLEAAEFLKQAWEQDDARAHRCHDLLRGVQHGH